MSLSDKFRELDSPSPIQKTSSLYLVYSPEKIAINRNAGGVPPTHT
jgi:hypothetical protein